MPATETSYDRGRIDGEVQARLGGHDDRLTRIEAATEENTRDINGLVLATRHLEEASKADKETALATAKALATAEKERRERQEDHRDDIEARWSPWQKLFVALAGIGAATGGYAAIAHLLGH
jgi:chemotaxis response regulator CheB